MAAGVGLVLDYQRGRPEITTRHRGGAFTR